MSGLVSLRKRCEHLFLRLARLGKYPFDGCSILRIFTQLLRAVADGDGFVGVLIDGHAAAFHGTSPCLSVDLEDQIVKFDGIVLVDRSLGLN